MSDLKHSEYKLIKKITEMAFEIDQLHIQSYQTTVADIVIRKVDGSELESQPLGIFPEELWESILNRVCCSKDIQNVFLAIPELDMLFHKKKCEWLFGLVLPHLMTKHLSMKMLKFFEVDRKWVQIKEVMNLRLVSKRWCHTIDRALQNEPNQPTSVSPLGNQNSPQNEHQFNIVPMSDFHLGMTIFHSAEHVDKFMEDMANHKGNPFPGKSVWVQPNTAQAHHSEALVSKCVKLFEGFGKHVDILEMEFYDRGSRCHLNICKNILNCLFKLPNLRSLTFKGEFEGQQSTGSRSDVKTSKLFKKAGSEKLYPKLPKLESFVWQVSRMDSSHESGWTIGMIRAYGNGGNLRKLGIEENLYWCTVEASRLLNSVELDLFLVDRFQPNLLKVETILGSLPCGQKLRKFCLRALSSGHSEVKVNLYELLSILACFRIENLVCRDLIFGENLDDKQESSACAVKSITSLDVQDNLKLGYDFLRLLPNLRSLTVHQSKEVRQHAWSEMEEESYDQDTFANKLRTAVLKASVPGLETPDLGVIWVKWPKLEMIWGSGELLLMRGVNDEYNLGFNVNVQYVRELGNKALFGWMPEWDPIREIIYIDEDDLDSDFEYDDDEEDDEEDL